MASQISRIETGVIENISIDILIELAKAFGVSVDYILGITTVSTPKSYDISELGLSAGAVKGLVTGTINVQMLSTHFAGGKVCAKVGTPLDSPVVPHCQIAACPRPFLLRLTVLPKASFATL